MLEPLGVLGFVTATIASIIGGLAALGVVFSFGIIAAQLLLTNVESYIVVGGGVLLLGFAGSRWTSDLSSRYLSYAVAIAVKLFTLYLIIGIGNSLAGQWGLLLSSPEATLNPRIYFQILGGALAYMMLAWYIPSLASSLYTGTVALSAAELAYMGRGVAAAGAAAGATAFVSGASALEGGRAVVEAAKFGGDVAAERGGWAGMATGATAGVGALAREGFRAAVPTLASRGNSVANRIAETRAIRRPRLAGYEPSSPQAEPQTLDVDASKRRPSNQAQVT
jgi:type IV secretion system protein TrbL